MNSRKIKKEIISLLAKEDWSGIEQEILKYRPKDLINPLFSAICRTEELVRWHAISAFGIVVPLLAAEEMEEARLIMRRFLWSLNDESGGIGWGAPESMGEIMCQHEGLAQEYLHMLVSYTRDDGPELFQDGNFLELPELQKGLLWGIGRVADTRSSMLNELSFEEDIYQYLLSKDPVICGMALWCLGQLGTVQNTKKIMMFTNDSRELRFYYEGKLTTSTVGQFAKRALSRISQ